MPLELKPCPFCGGQDLFIERLDISSAFVQCDSEVSPGCACMARGPVCGQDDDGEDVPGAESAAREWNRRADQQTVAQLQARVAELEAALQMIRAIYEAPGAAGRESWREVRRVLGVGA